MGYGFFPSFIPRMRFFIHILNVTKGNVGVLLRGGEAAMAEDFLHEAEIRAVFEQMGGAGMAQCMRRCFSQSQRQRIFFETQLHSSRRQSFSEFA